MTATSVRRVLNVGGNSKAIPIPGYYEGWDHLLLDIDPKGRPDIVCDARKLTTLAGGQFDAVYCSHNLEHYYPHDTLRVLEGFIHVLKNDGFADIRVPDVQEVFEHVVQSKMDIDDVLYTSPAGPITVADVIYGYGKEIKESGNDFFAHKRGFTPKSLTRALEGSGFRRIFLAMGRFQITALAFLNEPNAYQRQIFGLP